MKENLHVSDGSAGAIWLVDAVSGRNNAPNIEQFNTMPERTSNVPRQPYFSMKNPMRGAKMNVPKPDPATAIPFHFELHDVQNKINKNPIKNNLNLKC